MLDGYSVAYLLARSTPTQRVLSKELTTDPDVDERDDRTDVFGNKVVQLGIHRPHHQLVVAVSTQVEITSAMTPRMNPAWEQAAAQTAALRGGLALDVSPFLASSRLVPVRSSSPESAALVAAFTKEFAPGRPILDVISAVCSSIFSGYRFDATFGCSRTASWRVSGLRTPRRRCFPGSWFGCSIRQRVYRDRPPSPLPARRRQSVPTHRMPGARCGSPSTGGSTLTRPMASWALIDM
jgi:hypothetical protein